MTVLDLIKGSLRLTGSIRVGRGIGTSAQADALLALNAMLESWNNERLVIYEIVEGSYTWPAAATSRTIGPSGANFTAARPIRIETAVLINGDQRCDLEIFTPAKWAGVSNRAQTGEPEALFNNAAFPSSTLYLWPVPTAQRTLQLGTWSAISAFANTGVTIALPPGYERALMYNLALELAPQFPDTNLSNLVIQTARDSKADIKRTNFQPGELVCDEAVLSRGRTFDILSGSYR